MEKTVPQYSNRNIYVWQRLHSKKEKEKNSHKKYFRGQYDKTWM